DVVLNPPAGEDANRAVVHMNREVDGQLALDVPKATASVVGKSDYVSRCVKALLGGLEGGGAGFDRHLRFPILLCRQPVRPNLRPSRSEERRVGKECSSGLSR